MLRAVALDPLVVTWALHADEIVCPLGNVNCTVQPVSADDMHLTMSVSKVFTSTLIAVLEDRGDLDSQNAVETYLPEVRGSGWEGVSVRDVLDMASGIDCDQTGADVYTNPATPYYGFEASLGWLPPTPDTASSTYEYVARLGRLNEPGRSFDYSSANTFVLAWIAQFVGLKIEGGPRHAFSPCKGLGGGDEDHGANLSRHPRPREPLATMLR